MLERLGFLKRSEFVSREWMREHRQRDREPFVGVSIQFPIQKQRNEQAYWNSRRLRKHA